MGDTGEGDEGDAAGRNLPPLSLHVPQPEFRPGDHADFSALVIPDAGATPRPEIDAASSTMRDLAYGLIRVLDGGGKAVGPWAPRLAPEQLLRMLRAMITVRIFDDRMYRAQRQGKTSFYMKSLGEEAVSVAAAV